TTELKLPTGETLQAGTRVYGDVISMDTDGLFERGRLELRFDRMQLQNGTQFPISASILQGVQRIPRIVFQPGTSWRFRQGQQFTLQLNNPAQVAVLGTTL